MNSYLRQSPDRPVRPDPSVAGPPPQCRSSIAGSASPAGPTSVGACVGPWWCWRRLCSGVGAVVLVVLVAVTENRMSGGHFGSRANLSNQHS